MVVNTTSLKKRPLQQRKKLLRRLENATQTLTWASSQQKWNLMKKITKQDKANSLPALRGCKIWTRLAKRTGAEPCESPWVLEISNISLCWAIMCKTLCQLLISQIALQVLAGCSTCSKKIYVTPTEYFITKFRDMFTNTKITHKTGK